MTLKPEVATGSGDVSRVDDASPPLERPEAAEVTASAKLVSDGDATTGWVLELSASAAGRPCRCSSGACWDVADDAAAGTVDVIASAVLSFGPDAVELPTLLTDGSCSSGACASDVKPAELRRSDCSSD